MSMACIEDDIGRSTELPDEAERPSCVVVIPGEPRPLCSLCGKAPAARSSCCWSCYSKWRECGLPLPPRLPAGRPGTPALRRWLRMFDTATLIQMKAWIEAILAGASK